MWQDPIVAEIHQTRDRISAAHGDDLHAIFVAAQRGELVQPLHAEMDALARLGTTTKPASPGIEVQTAR